jgi:hypothetical protein
MSLMLDDRVPMEEVEICEGTWSEVATSEGKDKAEVEGIDSDWAAPPGLGAEGWATEEEGGKKRKEPQPTAEDKDTEPEEAMAVVLTPLVVVSTPVCSHAECANAGKGCEDWLSSPKGKEAEKELAEGNTPKVDDEQDRKEEGAKRHKKDQWANKEWWKSYKAIVATEDKETQTEEEQQDRKLKQREQIIIGQLESALEKLRGEKSQWEKDQQTLKEDRARLQDECGRQRQEIRGLKQTVKDFAEDLSNKAQSTEGTQAKVDSIKEVLEQAQQQLQQLSQELTEGGDSAKGKEPTAKEKA